MKQNFFLILSLVSLISMPLKANPFGFDESWAPDAAFIGGVVSSLLTAVHGIEASIIGKEASKASSPSDKRSLIIARDLEITNAALQASAGIIGMGLFAWMKFTHSDQNGPHTATLVATSIAALFSFSTTVLSGINSKILDSVENQRITSYIEAAFSGVSSLAFSLALLSTLRRCEPTAPGCMVPIKQVCAATFAFATSMFNSIRTSPPTHGDYTMLINDTE